MVRDLAYHFVVFLLVIGVVFGIFWGIKRLNSISMEGMDRTMEPEYPPGTYRLELPPLSPGDIVVGSAVGYRLPNDADKERLAWALAKEGQLVEARGGSLYVDGQKPNQTVALSPNVQWSFIVPRGCVFLMGNGSVQDSRHYGPIPLRNVKGRVP
jgi:hypothetical protein